MSRVPFEQVLDIFKQKNRLIEVNKKKEEAYSKGGKISQRGGIPPPPCMKPWICTLFLVWYVHDIRSQGEPSQNIDDSENVLRTGEY